MKVEMTFIEEFSDLSIVKVLDSATITTLDDKITKSIALFNVVNVSDTKFNFSLN